MSRKPKPDTSLQVHKPYTKTPDGLWLCPEYHIMAEHSKVLYSMMLAKMDIYHPERSFSFTYDEIHSITMWNRNRISACIKELVKDGWIVRERGGRYPHYVSLYKVDLIPLQKKYPSIRRTLPDYMKEFQCDQ